VGGKRRRRNRKGRGWTGYLAGVNYPCRFFLPSQSIPPVAPSVSQLSAVPLRATGRGFKITNAKRTPPANRK
jgi:hypothetical protein